MTALALLGGTAPPANALVRESAPRAVPANYGDWFRTTPEEYLRLDQCLMSEVLRFGGQATGAIAQDGLNQPPERLRVLANREYWDKTPLAVAFKQDREADERSASALRAQREVWEQPLRGLEKPGGIGDIDFRSPPGTWPGDDRPTFHEQTGLISWTSERFYKREGDFYDDPTPRMDDATLEAVDAIGLPLYGHDPEPQAPDRELTLRERDAFEQLRAPASGSKGADDARIFLASGGFPRTAPERGSAEFRIAVEDMKSRFASCAWSDPLDPSKVLQPIADTAAVEWQQEIASQAAQRNLVLTSNKDAVKSLTEGAKTLGAMLGQSWIADRLTYWQDFWSAGGIGWIGDSPVAIQVPGAKGKCLDVDNGGEKNGTPVQVYPCNGTAAQQWFVEGGGHNVHLRNHKSLKCLDVSGSKAENGRKIQIWDCNQSPAQTWDFNLRATTPLKNVGTGMCLDLNKFDNGHDAWLWGCNGTSPQQYKVQPTGHKGTDSLDYPDKAQFDQAQKGVAATQVEAKRLLAVLKAHAAAAKTAGAASDAAEKAAYAIADKSGAPRGRGLLVGQQKAQVTKGAVAALEAMVQAGETAEAATRAAAGNSATIGQRALAQAAQSKAEFRKAAAYTAELQAKAAADAAMAHRDNAKKDKETAEAKLALAAKAEADAKAAASEAHAKRLSAEAEEKTAAKEKATADAKKAEAAQHRTTAEAEASKAKDAQAKAESAEATATERRNAAVGARDKARDLRDDAWAAEQKANAARAKADAKEAYAQANESGDNATQARAAADAADRHATDAEAAAGRARTAADAATKAAADADAAATRAEAAAKRARADADAAQAAKLKADAAVGTATSAAADAIQAARDAASQARSAVKEADEAQVRATTAKAHADAARTEAGKALDASAKAAGFAHVTAQAAVDAGNAAAQVARPANDAIQLGSPYVTTDPAAGLVVLTGQSSKSIAEQQKAVADAHAKNAQQEAATAKALADAASADAKGAYQHAANATAHAARARTYAKEALGYAADAATAASKAAQSLARTVEHGRQATADAAAANDAANGAEGHAKTARDSADAAALDAEAAQAAAAAATQAATDARAAATRADTAATEAEEAAKEAKAYADAAQAAAESAERKKANQQVSTGAGTGIGGTFYVVDEDSVEITDTKQKNDCVIEIGFEGCEVTFTVTFSAKVDFFLCANPDVPASASGCPSEDTVPLGTETFRGLTKDVTQYFSKLDLIKQTVVYQILKAVLVQDFVDCWRGSASGCAWAASNFIPGKAFAKVAEAIRALDAAMHTGVGIRDAFNALKALDLDPATLATIQGTVNAYEDVVTACKVNSFPGHTRVLMADGSHKAIRDVRVGDRLLAGDAGKGKPTGHPVTDTFRHPTRRLVDITLADGRLTSTAGHLFHVDGRGWTRVSELRTGDRLRTPDGTLHAVTALRDRDGLPPREVFDLTVDGPHTFYVRTEGTRPRDVLVHNCTDIVADEGIEGAHTLEQHVNPPDAQMAEKARTVRGGVATRWLDEATAARAVDEAMREWIKHADNAKKLAAWKVRQGQRIGRKEPFISTRDLLTIKWTLHGQGSLGFKWVADGPQKVPTGNTVVIQLRYVGKPHRERYVVYTAHPDATR